MKALSPIDVENYSRKYDNVTNQVKRASELLLPDVYFMQKDQLGQVIMLLRKNRDDFNWFLNVCSEGVLFNESNSSNATVEANVNQSVVGMLTQCVDCVAEILLMGDDLDAYLLNLTVNDPTIWKLEKLVLAQKRFKAIVSDLKQAVKLISEVIDQIS